MWDDKRRRPGLLVAGGRWWRTQWHAWGKNKLKRAGAVAPTLQLAVVVQNGFNRSLSGANGTAYGKGVYFAQRASYSSSFCDPDSKGIKKMFLCRVVVGDYGLAKSNHKQPPTKNRWCKQPKHYHRHQYVFIQINKACVNSALLIINAIATKMILVSVIIEIARQP